MYIFTALFPSYGIRTEEREYLLGFYKGCNELLYTWDTF